MGIKNIYRGCYTRHSLHFLLRKQISEQKIQFKVNLKEKIICILKKIESGVTEIAPHLQQPLSGYCDLCQHTQSSSGQWEQTHSTSAAVPYLCPGREGVRERCKTRKNKKFFSFSLLFCSHLWQTFLSFFFKPRSGTPESKTNWEFDFFPVRIAVIDDWQKGVRFCSIEWKKLVCAREIKMTYRFGNTQLRPFLLKIDVIKANHSNVSATFLRDESANKRPCRGESK